MTKPSKPYQFVFFGQSDTIIWVSGEENVRRLAQRWKGLCARRYLESLPKGSMARAIARDLEPSEIVKWRALDFYPGCGTIKCEQAAPWQTLD